MGIKGFAGLAVALVALAATTASALPKIDKLRVSTTAEGTKHLDAVPEGTAKVFVIYEYYDAASQTIGLNLTGPGGLILFQNEQRRTGNGVDSVEISGAAIYRGFTRQLSESANAVQSSLKLVRDASVGTQTYLLEVKASILRMKSAVSTLEALEVGGDAGRQIEAVSEATDELATLVDDAIDLAPDDVEGKKAKAAAMDGPASAAADDASALQAGADAVGELPLPSTGGDGRAGYTVQVTINDDPSASVEFVVSDSPVPTATPEPRSTGARATATSGGPRTISTRAPVTAPSAPPAVVGSTTGGQQDTARTAPTAPGSSGFSPVTSSDPGTTNGQGDALAGSQSPQEGGPFGNAAPVEMGGMPEATWTVPANDNPAVSMLSGPQGADAPPSSAQGAAGSRGSGDAPSPIVLFLGVVTLGVLAVWLRRRM